MPRVLRVLVLGVRTVPAVLVLLGLVGCSDLRVKVGVFDNLDEARAAGAIAAGWVPDGLPRDVSDLREGHLPDGRHWGVFTFPRAEEAAIRGFLGPEITSGTLTCDPPGRLEWWPRIVQSPVNVEQVRTTGFKIYRAADARTYVVNWGQGRAYSGADELAARVGDGILSAASPDPEVRLRVLLPLILVATVCVPGAQQPAGQTFRSGREILTIEASVRDAAGVPLTGLQPGDFTVRIDGQTRAVLTVRAFGGDTPVKPAPGAVGRFVRTTDAAPGRVIVFAIDRDSVRPGGERAVFDAAASVLNRLAPEDAAGAVPFPGATIDLTRDHRAVADAIRTMTGTEPLTGWRHHLSWRDAVALDRADPISSATVMARECPAARQADFCPQEVREQAREMVVTGRGHADQLLSGLTSLVEQLEAVRAPKRIVLLSGGIPFDEELVLRYRTLADRAARANVALSVVALEQPAIDMADAFGLAHAFDGRESDTGLANIASITGGTFLRAVGRAGGVFDRIASDVINFYQLGVESRPSDAEGAAHRVEVTVARAGATVVSPAAIAIARTPRTGDSIATALRQPIDVAELPLDVAFYTTHSRDPDKVRILVAARAPDGVAPADWGFAVMDGQHVVEGRTVHVEQRSGGPWSATATVEVAPGAYRLRAAAVAPDGRMGVIDLAMRAGLRGAGDVRTSDLLLGTIDAGELHPRAALRQDEASAAMIELSSPGPLQDVRGVVQISRPGETEPVARAPLRLRTRQDDPSVVIAEGRIDLSRVPPGTYSASAVLERDGQAFARVSRSIDVEAGVPGVAGPAAPLVSKAAPVVSARGPALRSEPAAARLMEQVGAYVEQYGGQAAVILATEHYRQDVTYSAAARIASGRPAIAGQPAQQPGIVTGKGEQWKRALTSEVAFVQNAAAIGGWLAYRSVVELDGKPVGQADRLRAIFDGPAPDIEKARLITEESARYNAGPVTRTFNVPTAALFFFHPSNLSRFTFHRDGYETIDGVETSRITFQETGRPTLIMTGAGADVPSRGTLWVNPQDGSVLRTRLEVDDYRGTSSRARVDVDYRVDASLTMRVPASMHERYSIPGSSVAAEATYSDYRRFQTTVRIK